VIAEGLWERLGVPRTRRRNAGRRIVPRTRRNARRRVNPRLLAVAAVVLAILVGAWLWLRDSSLVAVKHVKVIGVSGPDSAAIKAALIRAAGTMTTLHVRMDQLNMAVSPYPVVKHLEVSTQFPHGLQIRVIEQVPVAALSFGGHPLAVASDGTVLHDVTASASLPVIPLRLPPGGSRVTGQTLAEVRVLGSAPLVLFSRIGEVTTTSAHGIVVQLRHGPAIYFGDAGRLDAKWAAAAAVLADSGSAGALYVDVTDPGRPAAGGGAGTSTTPSAASPSSSAAAGTAAQTPSSAAAGAAQSTSSTASQTPTTGVSQTPTAATTTTPAGG
jgi:cell division protein FtsQ